MSTEVVVKKSYLQVILLAMGHFFNDFYCNFLPILLPILIPKLGLSLTLSGALVMVMSLSANVLQPVFGYFMDKYNFNKINTGIRKNYLKINLQLHTLGTIHLNLHHIQVQN